MSPEPPPSPPVPEKNATHMYFTISLSIFGTFSGLNLENTSASQVLSTARSPLPAGGGANGLACCCCCWPKAVGAPNGDCVGADAPGVPKGEAPCAGAAAPNVGAEGAGAPKGLGVVLAVLLPKAGVEENGDAPGAAGLGCCPKAVGAGDGFRGAGKCSRDGPRRV